MVAIVVEKPHALAVADDRPAAPGPGEILVAVERAGICGSDMHILHGANPFATYPRIIVAWSSQVKNRTLEVPVNQVVAGC